MSLIKLRIIRHQFWFIVQMVGIELLRYHLSKFYVCYLSVILLKETLTQVYIITDVSLSVVHNNVAVYFDDNSKLPYSYRIS